MTAVVALGAGGVAGSRLAAVRGDSQQPPNSRSAQEMQQTIQEFKINNWEKATTFFGGRGGEVGGK